MAYTSVSMVGSGAMPYGYQPPAAGPLQTASLQQVQAIPVQPVQQVQPFTQAQSLQPQCLGSCPAVSYTQPTQQPAAAVAVPGVAPYPAAHSYYPYYGIGAEETDTKRAWYDCFGLFSKKNK